MNCQCVSIRHQYRRGRPAAQCRGNATRVCHNCGAHLCAYCAVNHHTKDHAEEIEKVGPHDD